MPKGCQLNQIDIVSLVGIVLILCKCEDGDLIYMLVQIENVPKNMYYIVFFTKRFIQVEEELTWDYSIDFSSNDLDLSYFVVNVEIACVEINDHESEVEISR